MSHEDGEGPVGRGEARERTKVWIEKAERQIAKGDKRDNQTRTDDLDDPVYQEPE